MNAIIFGSNGMLGNYVCKYLEKNNIEIIRITRNEFDLNNLSIDELNKLLIKNNISNKTTVINCAGIIPQSSKQHKLNSRIYFKINSIYPIILSMLCQKYNANFIHITTDCVFSGNNGKYNENDVHDADDDYGISKSLSDLSYGTIIRTSIIGEEKFNKRSLLEWVISNKNGEINGYENHMWNGLTCLQLAKIIYKIINEKLFWNGVRHIFSPRTVSKYELVNMINEIYELNIKINKFKTEKTVDKSITSIYESLFEIPDLRVQIEEMKFWL